MRLVSDGVPAVTLEDPLLRRIIERVRNILVEVINFNSVQEFDQNSVPTTTELVAGRMAIWKDADASSSNSTHFLVYNFGGTIVTFASVETVP